MVDLRALLHEVMENFRGNADEAGVALATELPDDPVWVRGDAVRLRQIFANLLSNGILYTPREAGRIRVKLGLDGWPAPRSALQDSGIGIAPEERERIFDLFYQAPQPIDRPRGGLGIGLTLAQRLARLHGGEIEVSSEGRDRGSTFRVSLPLADRPEACAASESPGSAARASCASPSWRTTRTSAIRCASCCRWTGTRC